jgi:isoleucyl-tRNA synthetase
MFDFVKTEHKILKFWQENGIFEKLREKNKKGKPWSFLDGPITANNPMGVHHAWGRTYKDLFQRYKAMQGYEQRYQNGFDCQGLWVEVEVEKELGFKNKKDIEKYGVDKFVEKCKERVKKFSKIQTEQSIRLGQWMDWDNSYYTMSDENNYAIWGFLKKCWKDGNLYKGRDSVPWCPRCGTAISQHEILTEEYKEITHEAVYFKLPILDKELKDVKFLVWTTTPWTIPANVALALHPDFEYGLYESGSEKLILLKDLAEKVLGKDFSPKKTFKGKQLKGIKYEGPFDNLPRVKEAREENPGTFHTVVLDKDLVTAIEGTGIIHIAPGAGEEDFKLGKQEKLPVISVIDESATYLEGMKDFSGKNAKENPDIILNYLESLENGRYFYKTENYTHRYPTCWRCKKELVWRVVDEWYISMDKLRKPLMGVAKKINWIPSFGLERELDWLKNMHDWLISKKRYWGLTLPIFECKKCGSFEVIGSKEELKERAIEGWGEFEGHSPHKPWVDNVKIKCKKCGESVLRIPDVGNPWLDAGIVPFSTMGYDSDRNNWKKWFPAELVCESFPGQFKNWFYSIIVMSTVLEKTNPVKTIFGYASVHDEKDEEMHKSKGNAIWFDEAVEKIGADPMRWMYARQNPVFNLRFGYNAAEETKRKLLTFYNVFTFFNTYVDKNDLPKEGLPQKLNNRLDTWIVSRFNSLAEVVAKRLDEYDSAGVILSLEKFFIDDLSLWYVRRSRKRFHEGYEGRKEAIQTLYYVLLNTLKLMAPVMPFFAEEMYLSLKSEKMPESIHLTNWPETEKKRINKELEEEMDQVRNIVNLALAKRAEAGVKVRQPLSKLKIKSEKLKDAGKELLDLVKDEVNVKEVVFDNEIEEEIELDLVLDQALETEGNVREIVRNINSARKNKGLVPKDKILTNLSASIIEAIPNIEEYKDEIVKETSSTAIEIKGSEEMGPEKREIKLAGKPHYIEITKINN